MYAPNHHIMQYDDFVSFYVVLMYFREHRGRFGCVCNSQLNVMCCISRNWCWGAASEIRGIFAFLTYFSFSISDILLVVHFVK